MATDPSTSTPAVVLDDEGRALQLEAEKAKLRQAIATADQATATATVATASARSTALAAAVPEVADAPTGTVTAGQGAGAFGPWLTHRSLHDAAGAIAGAVHDALEPQLPGHVRVLVVEDPSLLTSDWTHQQVTRALERQHARLAPLGDDLGAASTALTAAVAALEASLAPAPDEALEEQEPDESGALLGGEAEPPAEEGVEEGQAAPAPALPSVTGALGAAVGLLGLLRTDYTLSAVTTTASTSELALVTAGRLARQEPPIAVELDGFTTVPASPTLDAFDALVSLRDEVARSLGSLEAQIAPVDGVLTTLRQSLELVEKAWTAARTDADATADGVAALRAEASSLAGRIRRWDGAAAPARSVATRVRQVVADVDAAATALVQAPAGGRPDLLTAVARERLHASLDAAPGGARVTHVLVVRTDAAHGDMVTRRLLLGASGRVSYLGAVTTSWLLLDTATGALTGGGTDAPAHRLTHDVGSGRTSLGEVVPGGDVGPDWSQRAEVAAKGLVALLALVLAVAGIGEVLRLLAG